MRVFPSIALRNVRSVVRVTGFSLLISTIGWSAVASAAEVETATEIVCGGGTTLAGGDPDPALLSRASSKGVWASWCERYDESGRAIRIGPYRETYPNGQLRTRATYIRSRLEGPVEIHNEDGGLFLRGFLERGEWAGSLVIFHENGSPWLEARYRHGQLDGPLQTRHADGALQSEARFRAGFEEGLARSFYGTASGGRLKSEAHVQHDRLVGKHRILDQKGALRRTIDWDVDSAAWRAEGLPKIRAGDSGDARGAAGGPESPTGGDPRGLDAVWPIEPSAPLRSHTASTR